MDEKYADRMNLQKAYAEIGRLEQELRDARYAIGMLVHVAGGEVHISPRQMVEFDTRAVLTVFDDPMSGHRIMRLIPAHSACEGRP